MHDQSIYESQSIFKDILTRCALTAAWKNPPAQVAEVFARVLQQDKWGLKKVVIACLTTPEDSSNPYLSKKSNYQHFKDAITPADTHIADTSNATP